MQPFDETAVRDAIKATIGQGLFESALIRVGREGGEIRPPMVTVVPAGFSPEALAESGFMVPEATWPVFAYCNIDPDGETQLADFTSAICATLNADPTLGGVVKGCTIVTAAVPVLVQSAQAGGAGTGRKMLRRELTLQTRHR